MWGTGMFSGAPAEVTGVPWHFLFDRSLAPLYQIVLTFLENSAPAIPRIFPSCFRFYRCLARPSLRLRRVRVVGACPFPFCPCVLCAGPLPFPPSPAGSDDSPCDVIPRPMLELPESDPADPA